MNISSINSVSVNRVMDKAGAKPEALGGLADKFNRLMEIQPPTAEPEPATQTSFADYDPRSAHASFPRA